MKKKIRSKQKAFSLKDRFQYWFDNRMSKGTLGLIRVLIIASVILAVIIAVLIIAFGFNDGENTSVIWDSITTLINAWMPSFEDGSPGYIILMSIVAIAGVLFTSVLIGIVTSAIEEKIDNLKRGNSLVLEKDHIVVLGFNPGEFSLLNQLILAAAGAPACVVIAEDLEREEIERSINENLDVPKNFRFVCRTVDITDPSSLEKCSVETCATIIVNPTDDMRTIKAVLAVSALLAEKGHPEIRVNAIISKNEYRFPPSLVEANNITTLQTNTILAKMIAHSCTQIGLSEAFREVFNFEGSEFYLADIPDIAGLAFEELMLRLNKAVPAGLLRDDKIIMNPPGDLILSESDKVLVFSEECDSAKLMSAPIDLAKEIKTISNTDEAPTEAIILGHNETLSIILNELPENVSRVFIEERTLNQNEIQAVESIAARRNIALEYITGDPRSEKVMLELAKTAEHIVVLNDHSIDPEESDMDAMFLLLNLRDIRTRYGLHFNITVEMRKEHNQKLVGDGDHTDFLVASSMSSLILAQLAESPELIDVFRELLSNEGNELYLKNVGLMQLAGTYQVCELRRITLTAGYILLGYLDSEKNSNFNLPLDETLTLQNEDHLIVLGQN
ncbi:MAG: hypothetical protein II897_06765 [Clostridia bacterium]|nr:hypothetical protein [Clostridia bacterium]